MRMETGVKRLDELLGGGLPDRSNTLLLGPPYTGKSVLSDLFVVQGLSQGVPAVYVLTDDSAAEVSERLERIDASVHDHEEAGRLRYVDAYSKTVRGADPRADTRYVDSIINVNQVTRVMNEVQREILADHDRHRMVFDSVTTLIVNTNAQTAYRFLQVFLGRTRSAGGTGMLLLEAGIHEESEVRLMEHICDGVVETKKVDDRTMLRVEGLDLNHPADWVEYEFAPGRFEITGSFGAGRLR